MGFHLTRGFGKVIPHCLLIFCFVPGPVLSAAVNAQARSLPRQATMET